MTKALLLLCIVMLFLPVVSIAQHNQYQFSHLTTKNGLSNNHVTCIINDSKGFIWFGTVAGLNRYDGLKFKSFRHVLNDSTSLSDDYITGILEAPDKKLWVKTRAGYNIYDPQTEKFTRDVSDCISTGFLPKTAYINNVYTSGPDNLALLDAGYRIYLYNPLTKHGSTYGHKNAGAESIINAPVANIVTDIKNKLWLMHSNGVLEKFDPRLNKVVYRLNIAASLNERPTYYNIFKDSDDDLWIYSSGADNGVYLFNTSSHSLMQFNKGSVRGRLNSNIINSVTQDIDGMIWIATDHGGINLLNKQTLNVQYLTNREDDDKSIAQNSVVSVYKDNAGIIWAGTFKRGINYYHKNIIKFPLIQHYISDAGSLPFNDVNRFVEDASGNLWIGTNGRGLIYYNRQTRSFKQYKHDAANVNSVSNDVIVSLCIDHKQRLWIGSFFGGLDCFDGKTFKHFRHDKSNPASISDDRVWEIMEDSSHRLWVGTLSGGLNRFNEKENTFYHYLPGQVNSVRSGYISSIAEDRNSNIWVGTTQGIDVILKNSGKVMHYGHNEGGNVLGLVNDDIRSLYIDSRGWIWAPTREGLSVFNPGTGKYAAFYKQNGLPDNNILDVLEDNQHNMWVSTTNGLSNIKITAYKGHTSYTFNNYDETDGLQGLEFNESSYCKTNRGELIFGGANGFNIFYPGNIIRPVSHPKLIITDLQVFNKQVVPGEKMNGHLILPGALSETKQVDLKYNENVFSLEFTAVDFFNADKIKIQYKLDGFDKNWITVDDQIRKATYTNIAPGSYTFKLRSVGSEVVKANQLSLLIVVSPPLWKTPLACAFYLLAFAAILLYIRHRGIKNMKAQFAIEQERAQAHRLHELDMMKIKFFTNVSHEFRTPLSLILAPVDKLLKQTGDAGHKQQLQLITRNARRLLNLVNQLLDFRKMEEQELMLQVSNGDVVKFIEEIACSFNDVAEKKNISFIYDSDYDSFHTRFDHDKIERILFNLLSNAFKFTPENGHVSVLLSLKGGYPDNGYVLDIRVIDTGIGIPEQKRDKIFDRFFQNDVPGFMVNQGSGIGLAITKEFIKLHNGTITVESQVNEGSCFIVSIPLCSNAEADDAVPITPSPVDLPAAMPLMNKGVEKKPTILIVEDNDDFRFYLRDNIKEHFNVVDATNGREGWQKALAMHPNLIVSDISMPEMDGIELCKKLKADNRTKHIPVVLLTALTGEEQHLRGLETGASDYLTKPFNFDILLSKLKNILQQQEVMRKTYKKQVELNPTEVVTESPDDLFLQKALLIIERNIANTDFSVEELSSETYMSRVTLYKKTLALTGKSPVELIRSVRLKRAAQLLGNGYLTVSQVSYKVGFKSQKYFTKSFKAEFGVLPSAYLDSRAATLVN